MLSFRSGDYNVAYGNWFLGAGGIRIKEADNIYIYNNYFENAGVVQCATLEHDCGTSSDTLSSSATFTFSDPLISSDTFTFSDPLISSDTFTFSDSLCPPVTSCLFGSIRGFIDE